VESEGPLTCSGNPTWDLIQSQFHSVNTLITSASYAVGIRSYYLRDKAAKGATDHSHPFFAKINNV
jgi:hypothetical protein